MSKAPILGTKIENKQKTTKPPQGGNSVVAINFESKVQPGLQAIHLQVIPKPWPDSLSDAIFNGTATINQRHGELSWKPVQWIGLNLSFVVPKSKTQETTAMKTRVIDKNDLMLDIIKNKNLKKLDKYNRIFTTSERAFLKSKIK